MRPIRQGDRGPGVEDVQKRLLSLGYDIGHTGVDGVFLGATLAAVRNFQRSRALAEDGIVGPETWAALVDATFTLGDRLLYLRLPYFHGRDVHVLQGALNALGFACGGPDGIFGPFTEQAVREFQRNTGQHADGIVGTETVRAVLNLRHVWGDKDPTAPVALKLVAARAAEVLARASVVACHTDAAGLEVATRLANLAVAACSEASVVIGGCGEGRDVAAQVVLVIGGSPLPSDAPAARVAIEASYGSEPSARLVTALETVPGPRREVGVELAAGRESDERWLQHAAVGLLDGLCAALADLRPPVIP
ncbi:MAG TPA: peptidoglycan-binding protein [Coriobacteriia bacterium]|jgi:peptidoglycan hydrolase-like protein with peptidoglycan-binding domain